MRGVVHDPVPSNLELQVRLRQQQAVASLGQMALADVLLDDLLAEATRIVASELQAEFASLLEVTADGRDLIVRSVVGWPAGMCDHELLRAELSSQAAYTLGSEESVILDDAATETRFGRSPQAVAQGITSGISTSVGSNGDAFGVLSAQTRSRRTFTEHDVAFLEAVAHILSMSVRRQVAEAAAEKTHRMLEAVVMGTSDSIFVKDLDGRFLVLNDAAASQLGVSRSAVVGRALLDVLPKPQADVMLESDRHVLERGTVEHFEEEVALVDGTRVFLTTKGPYRGADGTVLGTFGIATDITERKRQEQELRAARDYAYRLIETSNAIVLVLDADANIRTFNRAAEEITGYRREEVIGRNWDMFLPRARFAEPWQKFDELITRGSPENYQNPIVTKSGERMILWQNTQMRDNDGQVAGTISFGIDVTETLAANDRAEELEARLRHAEKLEALGQLAGGVAHDFNNLLLSIRGYGESALAHIRANSGEPASDVEAMLGAADRAGDLTKQLLAFGRRQVLNPEIVDLNDVVRESVSLLERVIGEDFELVSSTPDAPIAVRADRGQLVRVITNLTLNARDAMAGGGVIRIRTTFEDGGRPARSALLTVTDEGTGIDSETALRIFEPFFTTKGDFGTGLGLATVYGIVAQSGGEITFDTTPGRGTTFRVSLPLESANDLAAPTARVVDLETNGCGGKETILLVEDDPAVRAVVSRMLTAHGYEVIATDTGTKAVELFETRDSAFDLVLTDLVMRDFDGRETARRIRDVNPTAKILYMSGYAADSTMRTDPLPANTAFIEKPFGGNGLALQVRRLLDVAPSLG
jgi:two-component system cell cycle sensor histidine kinase/response regulator CckA